MLSYALLLVAQNPETQARVATELDEVCDSRRPTLAELPRLVQCDAVIRETMRLYPPAYIIGRAVLEDVEIAGCTIPRGAQVLLPV